MPVFECLEQQQTLQRHAEVDVARGFAVQSFDDTLVTAHDLL